MVRCRTPDDTGNHFLSPRTETSGSVAVHARCSAGAAAMSGTGQLSASLRDPTRGLLRVAYRLQPRVVMRAPVHPKGAPRVERTPGGGIDQIRWRPFDWLERLPPVCAPAPARTRG